MDKKDISDGELKPFSHERIDPDNSYYNCKMIDGKLFEMAVDRGSAFGVIKYDDVMVEYDYKEHTMRYISGEKDIKFGANYYEGMNTTVKEADAERRYFLSSALGYFVYGTSVGMHVGSRSIEQTFELIARAISNDDLKLRKVSYEKFADGRTVIYNMDGLKEYEKLADGTEITYAKTGLKEKEIYPDGTKITYSVTYRCKYCGYECQKVKHEEKY